MVQYCIPLWASPDSRFQICPGLAKELEAGHAGTLVEVVPYVKYINKRRSTVSVEFMWRRSLIEESAERRNVPFACGLVDG